MLMLSRAQLPPSIGYSISLVSDDAQKSPISA
jgi:hypothetical protein